MKKSVCLLITSAVLAVVQITSRLYAQTSFGIITGYLIEPSLAFVPDVVITVTNEKTMISRVITSDANGSYVVSLSETPILY
jgi:hypothetical protein